jgi:hypothetical protein
VISASRDLRFFVDICGAHMPDSLDSAPPQEDIKCTKLFVYVSTEVQRFPAFQLRRRTHVFSGSICSVLIAGL